MIKMGEAYSLKTQAKDNLIDGDNQYGSHKRFASKDFVGRGAATAQSCRTRKPTAYGVSLS